MNSSAICLFYFSFFLFFSVSFSLFLGRISSLDLLYIHIYISAPCQIDSAKFSPVSHAYVKYLRKLQIFYDIYHNSPSFIIYCLILIHTCQFEKWNNQDLIIVNSDCRNRICWLRTINRNVVCRERETLAFFNLFLRMRIRSINKREIQT